MKPHRKKKLFEFLFSFIPGAAEMYLGFMRMGMSLLIAFVLCFVVPLALGFREEWCALSIVVWFYAFFHARNLAALSDEEFSTIEDWCFWEEFKDRPLTFRKDLGQRTAAILLILLACAIFWGAVSRVLYALLPSSFSALIVSIPQAVIALVILLIGLKRLRKANKEEAESLAAASAELPSVEGEVCSVTAASIQEAASAPETEPAPDEAEAPAEAAEAPAEKMPEPSPEKPSEEPPAAAAAEEPPAADAAAEQPMQEEAKVQES